MSDPPYAPGGRVLLERDGGSLGHVLLALGTRLARLEHGAREDAQPEAALLERAEVAECHGHAVRRGAHRRHEAHEQRVVRRVAHDAHGEAAHGPCGEGHLRGAVVADVCHAQAVVAHLNARSVQRCRESGASCW